MKRVLVSAVVTAGLLALAPFTLGSAAANNAAVHIDGFSCGLADGNGNFVSADTSSAVITQSGNGNMKCQADVTPSSGGTAVQFNYVNTGFLCSTPAGDTAKWEETVSAGGKATLSCHAKG